MFVRVELLIDRGALRPKVCAEVDYVAAELKQGDGKFRRYTVRKRQKYHFGGFGQKLGFWLGETEALGGRLIGEFRKDLADGLSGVLPRGNRGQLGMRMGEKKPDEFFAGITGSADNGDFFHLGVSSQ